MAYLDDSESFLLAALRRQTTIRLPQSYAMVVYGPPAARSVEVGETFALVPYTIGHFEVPKVSQQAVMAVFATGVPDTRRNRAWWFTLDGHTFYVLDLSEEGTFVYDVTTQQWSQWYTDGYANMWNMKGGSMWGGLRVVAGDSITGQTWVIDPTNPMDEGWRDMLHVVTGGIMLRGRVYVGMSSLNITGSAGQITSDTGEAVIQMRFSDDMGKTWSDYYPLVITQGDFEDETAWRSLGSFCNPGRLLEISDEGGMIRIDGLDANLNGFDEPPQPATGVKRG
jgi:hypothetical protein